MIETHAKGLYAQLRAEQRATELGYTVSRPADANCRYDMILDDGTDLKRIQIKYCDHIENGCVRLTLKRRKYLSYTANEIDALIVYVAPIDQLCYIPVSHIDGKQFISLRYTDPDKVFPQKMHFCQDYIW